MANRPAGGVNRAVPESACISSSLKAGVPMNPKTRSIKAAHVLGLAFLTLSILGQLRCAFAPESEKPVPGQPNRAPSVRITSGGVSPEPLDYRAQFTWCGSDEDGVVTAYYWAVDDTVSEHAWHETTGFTAEPHIHATTPDSQHPGQASDWHTFYVRAVDNELTFSPTERRYFNATTVAPASRITSPYLEVPRAELQTSFRVEWEGSDLDCSCESRRPEFFEYKLTYVPDFAGDPTIREALGTGRNLLADTSTGDDGRWVRVPESVRDVQLRKLVPSGGSVESYAFAVRAIDEAGAVEPELERGRNLITFAVTTTPSAPYVTISEATLGVHRFPQDGEVWDNVTVFVGQPYVFRWTGDASYYESEPGDVNYALDPAGSEYPTPHDPRGLSGWSGWGPWTETREPLLFHPDQTGSYHTLYVLMRDISNTEGSTRRCVVRMRVVDYTFSKYALLVDDAYFYEGIRDSEHDAYLKASALRQLYQCGPVDDWSAFGDNDVNLSPHKLPDELQVLYQNLIWNLNYPGGRTSGLFATEEDGVRRLSVYLRAGGRLFILGGPICGALRNRTNIYPQPPPDVWDLDEREKLYYNYLYMRNTVFSFFFRGSDPCATEASGLFIARSADPNFPDLFLDRSKWDPEAPDPLIPDRLKGGIRFWEGTKCSGIGEDPVHLEGLDTLYTAQTWNRSSLEGCGEAISPSNGAVCAWRYECTPGDTLAHRQHGRIIVFDFQPYYFERERLTDAGTAAVNWLLRGRDF